MKLSFNTIVLPILVAAATVLGNTEAKNSPVRGKLVAERKLTGKKGGTTAKSGKKGKKGSEPRQIFDRVYFDARLAVGDTAILLENGPFTMRAECDNSGITMYLTVLWPAADIGVYGDGAGGSGERLFNLPQGNEFETFVWFRSTVGNDVDAGAFSASTGHYVGWDGESVIGSYQSDASALSLWGDNVNCLLNGILNFAGFED